MASLNVPIPPSIDHLAADLHPKLAGFDTVRSQHTLVCKRFGVDDLASARGVGTSGAGSAESEPSVTHNGAAKSAAITALQRDLQGVLSGTVPFTVAVTGVDSFPSPASGSGPVVYLVVESEDLMRLHRRLCAAYNPISGIEGDEFVPHITLARGKTGDEARGTERSHERETERSHERGTERTREPDPIEQLHRVEFDPIRWRVHALDLYDPEAGDERAVAATIEL